MAKAPVIHKLEGHSVMCFWDRFGWCRTWCHRPPGYYLATRHWKDVTCKRCLARRGKRC